MKVTISERAEKNLQGIVKCLETEWSVRVKNKFLNLLETKIEQIKITPEMYVASSKKKNIRRCVLGKQTSLYCGIKKQEIEIITIPDNRANPRKLKL